MRKNTYLFYSSSSLAYPHFGVQLEEALVKSEEGHNVIFAYCDGVINTCFKNFDSNPFTCKCCKFGYTRMLKKYENNFKIIKLKSTTQKLCRYFIFKNIKDIKKIKYKGVGVGYSVLAFYVSMTRNPDFEINESIKSYINGLINETCKLIDAAFSLITEFNPDFICIYNGRFFETKPFFDIGIQKKIEVIINEVVGTGHEENPLYITKFNNCTPHDIPNFAKKVLDSWTSSLTASKRKTQIGESFFKNKRNGINTGQINFTENQVSGLLPKGWDNSKKNIVIFNSSEDEFVAIGKEFDSYSLFQSQIEGIKHIVSSCKSEEIYFYLRIHPNLKDIRYAYHINLLEMEGVYKNLKIIKADDVISSYALIDFCWKVIVFGSTIGIEAVYWGKPVILLAGAMYRDLNVTYTPQSIKELEVLINADLQNRDNKHAIMYGYYLMERNIINYKPNKLDLNLKTYKIFGRYFYQPKYLTIFKSQLLYKLFTFFLLKIGKIIQQLRY